MCSITSHHRGWGCKGGGGGREQGQILVSNKKLKSIPPNAPINVIPEGGDTWHWVGALIASSIPRVGICTNFEIASSPRVWNFDQMRRRAVLVASYMNELRAKKAAIFCKILDLV